MKTKTVRIAVVVDQFGDWACSSMADDQKPVHAVDDARSCLATSDAGALAAYLLTAKLPVPGIARVEPIVKRIKLSQS